MTTELTCICSGILDFEDGFYVCVNPDCEVVTLPSTIAQDMEDYREASRKLTAYWKKNHKEYEAYD